MKGGFRHAASGGRSLVAGVDAQHVDDTLVGQRFVDQSMLDVDATRVATREITDELFESEWGGQRVGSYQLLGELRPSVSFR